MTNLCFWKCQATRNLNKFVICLTICLTNIKNCQANKQKTNFAFCVFCLTKFVFCLTICLTICLTNPEKLSSKTQKHVDLLDNSQMLNKFCYLLFCLTKFVICLTICLTIPKTVKQISIEIHVLLWKLSSK